MHLKQKAKRFGVPVLYTLTLTLSTVGRCEPTDPLPNRSFLTSSSPTHPSTGRVTGWSHLGSRRWKQNSSILHQTLRDLIQRTRSSGGAGPDPRSRLKRRQADKEKLFSPHRPPQRNCSRGFIKHVFPGKFYITGHFEPNLKHLHQVDPVLGQEGPVRSSSQQSSSANESWQKLEPSVECGDDSMLLTVRRKRAMQLLLDRANESSLLLFQLPPQCGYSVRTTVRDFILRAQYDACHVSLQDENLVLPLLWRGIPVKVSCPVSQISLPGEGPTSLCCSTDGMTFRLGGRSAEEPRVNVRGEWTPLSLLAQQCGYTLHRRDADVLVAAPFLTCGVTVKDGKHTLSLQMGKKAYMLACLIPPFEKLPVTHQSLADSPSDLTKRAATPNVESLGPLPWIPPFYLAPPNYPHPTYPQLKERISNGSPNPPSLTHEAALSPQSKHKDHYHQVPLKEAYRSPRRQMKNSGQAYQNKRLEVPVLDLLENSITATHFPVQVETPHPPPPGHDFSSYYHYYHLPKIPLPGVSQDPDPGPGLPTGSQPSTKSQKREFPSTLPNLQPSERLDKATSDEIPLPVTTPAAHTVPTTSKVSALYASYPLQPLPFFYYYFPHSFKGEAKRLGLLHPDLSTKTNLSFVLSPHSSHSGQEKRMIPALNKPETDKTDLWKLQDGKERRTASVTPVVQFPSLQRYTPKPVPPDQHVLPTPGFTNADPYKYYYHPYYNYDLKYFAPEVLRGKQNHGAQTTTKAAAPSGQPSHHKHQTIPPPAEYDIQKRLYYYYLYYLHQMLKYNQKLHHQGVKDMSASQLSSDFDSSEFQRSAAEVGRSGPLSLHPVLQSLYSHYSPQHPPSRPSEQRGGPGVKGTLGKEMRAPPPPPDDATDSCGLQKLTSPPDVHSVPQDGCGLNKHLLGQNLDLQSIRSHGDGGSSPPVRLVVGCSSSPPTGEVRFNTKDEPPPPSAQRTAAAMVLLRITADESFSSFYPEAHLPLSLMQGRPVYVELKLLEPSEPSVVLLVHSCLAYAQTPELRWVLFYDSCSSGDNSQLLPSSDPQQHIQRIKIPSFPPLPVGRSPHRAHGGHRTLEDPEVYFLCLTELCSTAHGDCSSCIKGPNNEVRVTQ